MPKQVIAYALHGEPGTYQPEFVPVSYEEGHDTPPGQYGKRLPTGYKVQVQGKWRRVYASCDRWFHRGLFIGKSLEEGTRIRIDTV